MDVLDSVKHHLGTIDAEKMMQIMARLTARE